MAISPFAKRRARQVIFTSRLIAGFEYLIVVPIYRIGLYAYSLAGGKTVRDIITLTIFFVVSYFHLEWSIRRANVAGFALILAYSGLIFLSR